MKAIGRLLIGSVVAVALSVGLIAVPASAASVTDRYYRETVAYGARDIDVYHIAHVRELQYRLKWLGLYSGSVNGSFTSQLKTSVMTFQRTHGLSPDGIAGPLTWARLLPVTTRGISRIPAVCRTTGWHACYDRTLHQVVLFRNNVIINTWLVRGGASTLQTRVGNFSVYYRDVDHFSSQYKAAMPYSQFFSGGQALHGGLAMMDPFVGHSHGCVNMYVEDAYQLWRLTAALPLRTLKVHVYGAWS